MAILEGSVYSCDLKDLAFVSKGDSETSILLVYKQGASIRVSVSSVEERNRQYDEIVTLWRNSTVTV